MKHFIKKRCFILQIKDSNAKVPGRDSLLKNQNIGRQINAMSFLEFFKNANHGEELTLSQSD